MIYEKPKLKYTEMAMYIDEHKTDKPLDNDVAENIFIYLYHIIFMLAHTYKLFSRNEYYEDFAIWLASDLFKTLTSRKENQEEIKSSLNYIKSVLRFRKYKFEQEFYSQTIIEANDVFNDEYSLIGKMRDSIETQSMNIFKDCLDDIILTSRSFLKLIPYANDKVMWNNIYISCLLTLLSSIVLDNESKVKIEKRFESPDVVMKEYLKNNEDIILFHLDDNMREYIRILTRELKHLIAKDISQTIHSHDVPSDLMNNLVLSEVNNLVTKDGGDD